MTAATTLVVWPHPGRVKSEAAYASIAGVDPIPASSGNTTRQRLTHSFGGAASDIGLRALVSERAGAHDGVQCAVEVPVSVPVQAVAGVCPR